jgi:hypothetical protein
MQKQKSRASRMACSRAFSSEVDTGSREENVLKQRLLERD